MKRLDLTPGEDASTLYNLLWLALHNPESRLDRRETREHVKILDKVEAIGKPDGQRFVYNEQPATLLLEDAEHTLVQRMVTETRFVPAVSRSVSKLYDWLDAATDYKPEVAKAPQAAVPAV